MRTRTLLLGFALVALALLAGCSSRSTGTPDVTVPTNGTPVMVELYTDW
ncbi:MAG: hypothetical protein ACYC77_01405 [Coriobacteriia bacterium]